MEHVKYDELPPLKREALDEAVRAMERAYNPYSHFYVGACLVSANGELVSGANVENAAYGSTICAERSALVRANAMGIRKFWGIAIVGRGENFATEEITGPCGSCRQMLFEAFQLSDCGDFQLIMATTRKDKIIIATIQELLPLAFGPKNLGIDVQKYHA